MGEKSSLHSETTITCKRICRFLKHFFCAVLKVGLLLIFTKVCVDSHMYTNEEHCVLCWVNKKIVLEDEIAENQRDRLRGGFYWPLVFD